VIADTSKRACAVKPSPTLAVSKLASQLRAEGRQVVDLEAGKPDGKTPDHIRQAEPETPIKDEQDRCA